MNQVSRLHHLIVFLVDGTAISEFHAEVGKGAVISCYGNYFVEDHPGSKVIWSKNEEPIKLFGQYGSLNCCKSVFLYRF